MDYVSGKLRNRYDFRDAFIQPSRSRTRTSTQFFSLKILALLCQGWVLFFIFTRPSLCSHKDGCEQLWSFFLQVHFLAEKWEFVYLITQTSSENGDCLHHTGIFSSMEQSLGQGDEIYWLAYTNQGLPLELLEEGSVPFKLDNWEIQGFNTFHLHSCWCLSAVKATSGE